jgi:response regulator NasT
MTDGRQVNNSRQICNKFLAAVQKLFAFSPRKNDPIVSLMQAPQQATRTVLVVDDNQIVTRSLMTLLRAEGFEPKTFQTGRPALDYIREHCPDIALIDIHLPDISGLELSRELRKIHGNQLPIIIFSGDSSIDTLRSLPDAGATFFLSKPVNVPHLIESLRQYAKE